MSSSSQHAFSSILETVYGTTPATPAFVRKNITAISLALSKGKIESQTINPNRQVQDVRHGNRQIGGDLSYELAWLGHDDFIEAVMGGTWTDDVLTPGTTRRSFSLLRQFTELAGGDLPFHLFKGCEFNTFSLTVAPEQIVAASMGIVGREVAYLAAAPTGTTYVDPQPAKGFDSFSGNIQVDGVDVATVTEATLQIENGITPRFVVFDDRTIRPKVGKVRVTGQLTTYFQDSSLLAAFNGAVRKSLSFSLVDEGGNTYTFDFPSVLGFGGQTDAKGEDDITLAFPFTAIYEPTADDPDALVITRIIAP